MTLVTFHLVIHEVHVCGSERNVSTNIGWIVMNFDDPLTFHVAPSSDLSFTLSNTLVHDQIPAKLMTFPSGCTLCLAPIRNCMLMLK